MSRKRKGVSKKTRFSVFARDGFQCKYCGRSSKETELQLDHIEPHSKGGSDSIENLLTACRDCNAGKGARLLESMPDNERLRLAQERQELEAAMEEKKRIARLREESRQHTVNAVCEELGVSEISRHIVTAAASLEEEFGLLLMLDWVTITSRAVNPASGQAFAKYMWGIARNVREERKGA